MVKVKCPNPMCLDGTVFVNVGGKKVPKPCKKCGGTGTVEKK